MSLGVAEYRVRGDGRDTLVFLHGLGGDHTNWRPQLDHFSTTHRCVAWTLPGFGDSPALDELTWPDLGDALARVFDDAGIDRATVVGLSLGGYIAQQFAADHDDRVDRLVLAATTAQFGRGSASFAERFLAARLAPLEQGQTPADFAPDVVPTLLSDDASAEAIANAVTSMSRISPDAYRQTLECLVTWNFVPYLDEITMPTLCLAGANDTTAPVAAMQALAAGLPDGRLEVIENCGHLMNLDRPADFNRRLRRFLSAD